MSQFASEQDSPTSSREPLVRGWLGGRLLLCLPALVFAGSAGAHDFEVHQLTATQDWCKELHRVAHAADVIELAPGRYVGGCDLTLGGDAALSEAMLVYGVAPGETIIEADNNGLSLRISGEPTRIYQLQLEGRLEVVANNTTVDSCTLSCLEVDPLVERFTMLFSEAGDLDLVLSDTVIRGNALRSLRIDALTGLVADNLVHGDLTATNAVHRNLILGNLTSSTEAHANIVVGDANVSGLLYGNTLLGRVQGEADARNNLTTVANLDPSFANVLCPDCLTDPTTLDVQPIGTALTVVPVEAPDDSTDFCASPRTHVGAVGPVAALWTAYDRDRFGCEPGLGPISPPVDECVVPPDSTQDVILQPESKGCSTAPSTPWLISPRRRSP